MSTRVWIGFISDADGEEEELTRSRSFRIEARASRDRKRHGRLHAHRDEVSISDSHARDFQGDGSKGVGRSLFRRLAHRLDWCAFGFRSRKTTT